MKKSFKILAISFLVMVLGILSACQFDFGTINPPNQDNQTNVPTTGEEETDSNLPTETPPVLEPSIKDDFACISIAEAMQLAQTAGDSGTVDKYYVYGTVKEILNYSYGEMIITDGVDELYIYGVYGQDEQTHYDKLADKPLVGDEVVLLGILKTYKEKIEMERGYLQALKHNVFEDVVDPTEYLNKTIIEARNTAIGTKLQLTGVVAQITYAFGQVPNGFYLVDNTASIYVYGKDVAGSVSIGNSITVIGEKEQFILETEQTNALLHGYQGSIQIENAKILENDYGKNDFDTSWIVDSTVKKMLDTPLSENITNMIYKVNALVNKVENPGFVNYYFDDIDGVTGSYTYTSCSGADFNWLDQFDGEICTVYLTIINAKATKSGTVYRFVPIKVINEGYRFDLENACSYALEYHGKKQFLAEYEANPAQELLSSVSNEMLGIENIQLSYESSNTNIVYFAEVNGKIIMHTENEGSSIITITADDGIKTLSATVTVSVSKPQAYNTINVKKAIDTPDGEEVIVKGIVASSLVNQMGFYLVDETGLIAVVGNQADIALLSSGDEVIIQGTKGHKKKYEDSEYVGQNNIYNAKILVNYYGNNEYSTASFKHNKTIEELSTFDAKIDYSTDVYVVEAMIEIIETNYYTKIQITGVNDTTIKFGLYCSGAGQYAFLKEYAGKVVTLELALCNWNSKSYYTGCVISATYNGVKCVNTLNFNE